MYFSNALLIIFVLFCRYECSTAENLRGPALEPDEMEKVEEVRLSYLSMPTARGIDVEALEKNGTHVKLQGYMVENYNLNQGDCTNRLWKGYRTLNKCVPTATNKWDGNTYVNVRAIDSVIEDVNTHQYSVMKQFFWDKKCTKGVETQPYLDGTRYKNSCFAGSGYYHSLKLPQPEPQGEFGFALVYYNNPTACNAGEWKNTGYVEYHKMKKCFTNGLGKDMKYISCDENGLTSQTFPSSNGSCYGAPTNSMNSTDSSMCSSITGFGGFYGGGGHLRIQCLQH
jgi:hypothetical protein